MNIKMAHGNRLRNVKEILVQSGKLPLPHLLLVSQQLLEAVDVVYRYKHICLCLFLLGNTWTSIHTTIFPFMFQQCTWPNTDNTAAHISRCHNHVLIINTYKTVCAVPIWALVFEQKYTAKDHQKVRWQNRIIIACVVNGNAAFVHWHAINNSLVMRSQSIIDEILMR